MKRLRLRTIIAWVLVLLAGVSGFTAIRAARPAPRLAADPSETDPSAQAVLAWLGVPDSERAALLVHDPSFAADLRRLRAEVAQTRSALASGLDAPSTSDADIRSRSEAAIAAAASLERRVTDHLLAIRPHLSAEQQRKLFGLCAEGVRQGRGSQWRHGQGSGQGRGPAGTPRAGRGPSRSSPPTTGG